MTGRHDVHPSRRVARVVLFAVSAALLAGWAGSTDDRGAIASSHAAPIAASRMVQDRVDALRARFRVAAPRSLDPLAGWVRARHAPVTTLPALGAAVASGFELRDGAVHALIPAAAKRGVARSASVALPLHAGDPVRLEDDTSHVAVSFALRGASAAPLTAAGGIAMYAGALGGADVLHRVHAAGTEDYVVFEQRPPQQALAYDVDVSRVAGLRLVGNTLEFLDASGAPRLRVAPPYVVDATGARTEARLAVTGCAFDSSPRAPWRRTVTPPGASHCTVRVAWNAAAYPAMLDPGWTTTGLMAHARWLHTATLLESGATLIAGGVAAAALTSAELYDPGTGTFAATDSLAQARWLQTATLLDSGKVLVAGGWMGGTAVASSAELYDETTGKFTAAGSLATARMNHTATLLASGKVLIAGGDSDLSHGGDHVLCTSSAELYDPDAGKFVATGPLTATRGEHGATRLASGKVLITGGLRSGFPDVEFASPAEVYDPGTGTFSTTGSMTTVRGCQTATLLDSGKVLVAGGVIDAALHNTSSAELYDPDSGTFSATGSMMAARCTPSSTNAALLLGSGLVLISGGRGDLGALTDAEFYDPATGTFSATEPMATARFGHTATLLASGNVLVAGGQTETDTGRLTANAELFNAGAAGTDAGVDSGADSGTDSGPDAAGGAAPGGASSGCSCRMAEPWNIPSQAPLWLGVGSVLGMGLLRRRRRSPSGPVALASPAVTAVHAATRRVNQ